MTNKIHFKPKELEVMKLISNGWTHKKIADKMGLSKSTVDYHRDKVYKKIGANCISELTRYYIYNYEIETLIATL